MDMELKQEESLAFSFSTQGYPSLGIRLHANHPLWKRKHIKQKAGWAVPLVVAPSAFFTSVPPPCTMAELNGTYFLLKERKHET